MTQLFDCAAIIGVGLIGGSLAHELKDQGLAAQIRGAGRTRENLELAFTLGLIDEIADTPEQAAEAADLIVLCTPVRSMPELVRRFAPVLKPAAVVTDVGSTKYKLTQEIEALLPEGVHFVPGHPIAGREKTGAAAATPGLFKNRLVILTPTPRTNHQALALVKKMWEKTGARVELLDAELHDRILAAVSHLPHLVAYALVQAVMEWDMQQPMLRFSAGGLHDFTRIAGSSPEMWRDICLENKEAIIQAVDHYLEQMSKIKGMIEKGDEQGLLQLFAECQRIKELLDKARSDG